MKEPIEIADDLHEQFVATDWIGQGKTYPYDNPPSLLEKALKSVIEIPIIPRRELLSRQSSIADLLNAKFPTQSSSIQIVKAQNWFHPDLPMDPMDHAATTDIISRRAIPSLETLRDLEKTVGQAWLDGKRSVIDWNHNNGRDCLPLWTLSFWREMSTLIAGQAQWRVCERWLASESKTPPVTAILDDTRTLFHTLSWDAPIQSHGALTTSLELSRLLGTGWITGELIDMMLEHLSSRLRLAPDLATTVLIAPLAFADAVQASAQKSSYSLNNSPLLKRYEEMVKDSGRRVMYFPLHVRGNHWVALKIDFDARTFACGDSLEYNEPVPSGFISKLQRWFRNRFDTTFRYLGNTLPHGVQSDHFSCGICAVNTIAHGALGDVLWNKLRKAEERASWFTNLAGFYVRPHESPSQHPTYSSCLSILLEQHPEASLAIAQGDHNFPDLPDYLDQAASEGRLVPEEAINAPSMYTRQPSPDGSQTEDTQSADWENDARASSPSLSAISIAPTSYADIPSLTDLDLDSEAPDTLLIPIGDDTFVDLPVESMGDISEEASMERDSVFAEDILPTATHTQQPFLGEDSSGSEQDSGPVYPLFARNRNARGTPKKRQADADDSDTSTQPKKCKLKYSPSTSSGAVGIGRSSVYARANRQAIKEGTFVVSKAKFANWQTKIHRDSDLKAGFDPADPTRIRHSVCGQWYTMKEPYDVTRFESHVKECKGFKKKRGRRRAAGVEPNSMTLDKMAAKFGWKATMSSLPKKEQDASPLPRMLPCPGLTAVDDKRIATYLRRPGAVSAGSRSEHVIAKERFGRSYNQLSEKEKKDVRAVQKHEHRWTLDHDTECILSRTCMRDVPENHVATDGRLLPCEMCRALLEDKQFKVMLQKPLPTDKAFRYTNKRFRKAGWAGIIARVHGVREILEDLDAKHSIGVRFAMRALQGKFKEHDVFLGLVEGMVMRQEREDRGVGLQNFRWSRAYDVFASSMRIESPRAYRVLSTHIATPEERNLRRKEAGRPKVPLKIGRRTFILAAERLKALNYDGPVALSCDDTKLFPALRLFWDKERDTYTLVGATDGPHDVADPDQVMSVMEDMDLKKATKVRLWVLQVPLPKVTPILLAAMPLDALSAEELCVPFDEIIDGLVEQNIIVISYSCDGTEVERTLERLKASKALEYIRYTIKNPRQSCPDLLLVIPTFGGHPLVMGQDSKHGSKTFRNNLYSGARILTLGNYTATYSHVRAAAFEDGSPLYHRDVEKLDRQDDNAASRLFSSATLAFFIQHYPNELGVIVFNFCLADLTDAWQNRTITHAERIKMVLRARYFLDMWGAFLDSAKYKRSQHFISREAADIAGFLIEALISLVLVHRDYLKGEYPLLPWLHSTETCEHVFGEARQIVQDFTMLDFYYMMPKLMIKLREATLRTETSDPKARASGYAHTYLDAGGIDGATLATFPSDEEISTIAAEAADEAESLIHLLGINPALACATLAGSSFTQLPEIGKWYGTSPSADSETDDSEAEDDWEAGSVSEAQQVQDILDREETDQWSQSRSHAVDEQLRSLSFASFAVAADELSMMDAMPDPDRGFMRTLHSEESHRIKESLSSVTTLAPFDFPDEASKPFGMGDIMVDMVDLSSLIRIRQRHETRQARDGVRTAKTNTTASESTKKASMRRQIIDKFHEILKSQQEQAPGTGADRTSRWLSGNAMASSSTGNDVSSSTRISDEGTLPAGNSANAAVVADATARKALSKRQKLFRAAKLPALDILETARVSPLRPLRVGDHAIVYVEGIGLMIGKVITIYSKSGGKNGKHGAVPEVKNVAAISYVAVEAYSHVAQRQFTTIPHVMVAWQTKRFALLPSYSFLFVLSGLPSPIPPMLRDVEINAADGEIFRKIRAEEFKLPQLMKAFRKRGQGADEALTELADD